MLRYLNNFLSLITANFISNVISVITFPIFIRKIGVESFGDWTYLVSLISIFSIFQIFGSDTVLAREISAKRLKAKVMIRQVISFRLIIFVIIILLIFAYNLFFNNESIVKNLFYVYVLPTLFLNVFSNELILNCNELFKQSSILKLINQIIYAISIIFFVNGPNDIYYAALGISIGSFISTFIGWMILFSKGYSMIPIFSLKALVSLIKKSYLYFTSSLCSLTYNRYGVIVSKIFLNDYELGLYSAGIRLIEIILDFLYIVPKPFNPRITLLIEENKDYMKLVRLSFKICILSYMPIAIGLYILRNDLILNVLGSNLYDVIPLITFLIPALIFSPFSVFFASLLVSFEKHKSYFISVFIGAIISLVILTLSVTTYGIYGILLGYTFSHFCIMVINYTLIKEKISNLFFNDNIHAILKLILTLVYAFVIIYLNSIFFDNIFLLIGFPILMYLPVIYFSIKSDFLNIDELLDNSER